MIRDTSAQDRPLPAAPRRRRRAWLIAGGLVALLGLAGGIASFAPLWSAGRVVSESRLTIATAERGPFVRDIAAEGKVVAAASPTLFAPNAGTVTLKVHAGDTVRQGQVLAHVDSPELNARLAQELSNADAMQAEHLRAQVDARQQRAALHSTWENARIDQTAAENDLARHRKAFDAGAVSGMQVDHAKDTLDKARIAFAHAAAGLGLKEDSLKFDVQARRLAHERQLLLVKDLQRQLGALDVRSPVDGQVGQLLVAERASVAKDAPLMSVVDLSALEVEVKVPESQARELAIGMAGEITGSGGAWRGIVSAVSPEVVGNEVAARLRFVGDAPGPLRQNQRLAVRVLIDRRDGVLAVRRGGFADEAGGAFAYVVRDGIAHRTAVRIGARSLDKIELLGGVQPGDRIVIAGADAFGGAEWAAIGR